MADRFLQEWTLKNHGNGCDVSQDELAKDYWDIVRNKSLYIFY